MNFANSKQPRVCFSYAAYAKNVIHYINSSNIPVEPGLSDDEFAAVESTFGFKFPPDLRFILQEGLPVGPGFPNWRSSSQQQLSVLTNLPILGICREVSKNRFWLDSWGKRPNDNDRAVKMARELLKTVPVLVPIYGRFYVPSTTPCMAGNPVFYVHGGEVRVYSFDIVGFFLKVELRSVSGGDEVLAAPVWAAKEARRVEFWTEVAERGGSVVGWWSGELGGCLEEVYLRLRSGGWKEEDIREMMMIDGRNEPGFEQHTKWHKRFVVNFEDCNFEELLDKEGIERRVRVLSARLLRAGWSVEDVAESLGFVEDCHID